MKYKLAIALAALLGASALAPTSSQAIGISINVGDQGYYSHGPWYYNNGVRWYWIPGHWAVRHHHRVWVHGHYAAR